MRPAPSGLQTHLRVGDLAWGRGARQGECLLAVRGKHVASLHDRLTNARMGVKRPSGYLLDADVWRAARPVVSVIAKRAARPAFR